MIPRVFRNKNGEPFVKMHIDIMVNGGRRFYATAHIQVPLEYSFKLGMYSIPVERIEQLVLEKYPTVRKKKYNLVW